MSITIKRAEGVVEFCTDLSLRSEWEEKNEALIEARATSTNRLADPDTSALAAEVRELEKQMEESTLLVRMRAVPRKRWAEAVAANPPREGNENDEAIGMNSSGVFDELLKEPGTIIAVTHKATGKVEDFDPAVDWEVWSDEMSDAQFSMFGQKVFDLNRGTIGRPFSRPASRVTDASEAS